MKLDKEQGLFTRAKPELFLKQKALKTFSRDCTVVEFNYPFSKGYFRPALINFENQFWYSVGWEQEDLEFKVSLV